MLVGMTMWSLVSDLQQQATAWKHGTSRQSDDGATTSKLAQPCGRVNLQAERQRGPNSHPA